MAVTQKAPAVVLAVLLLGTWAVPAAVSRAVEPPVSTVGADQQGSLRTAAGTTVTFRAPEGWSTTPSSTRTSTVYTRAQDDQEITLSVIDGSQDFDTTADRVLREQSLNGTSAAFDGGRISSAGGFTGKSCVAVKPAARATGPCAVVHQDDTVVTITATSTGKGAAPDLQTLVDSLAMTKGEPR